MDVHFFGSIEYLRKEDERLEKESIYTYDGLNEEDEKFLKIIEPEELYDKITNGENPYIIDTRGSMAFKNNNIKGSINRTCPKILDKYF